MAGANFNNTTKKPAVSNGEVDIDVSTPPTDGQVLIYDAVSGKYIPGTVSGSGGGVGGTSDGSTYIELVDLTPTGSSSRLDLTIDKNLNDVPKRIIELEKSAAYSVRLFGQISTLAGSGSVDAILSLDFGFGSCFHH